MPSPRSHAHARVGRNVIRIAVIGAGPAGSTAALALARGGAKVSLFERSRWPREKACGDGLTPMSVAKVRELGLALPTDRPFATTLVSGPRETSFRAPWPTSVANGTTLERVRFDALLVDAAVSAGVAFESGVAVRECAGGRVRLQPAAVPLSYDAVVLAEGGVGALAPGCGFGPFAHRLVAFRGYVTTPHDLAPEYQVHYARELVPGYAWIFPVAPGLANVGAVLVADGDVRAGLRRWLATSAIARNQLGPDARIVEGRGGVINIGREKRYHDRVFVAGDAAGIADPLSAEGVSQAMTSGTLVARRLLASRGDIARAGAAYERDLRVFDRNNYEALRMRALFGILADPMVAIARARPRFARHVVAAGYFPKRDAAWFTGTIAALRA